MGLVFEWSSDKAARNKEKHGVTFGEAATAFADPLSLTIEDPLHSTSEQRLVLLGMSSRSRLLVVVHTEREGTIRIISARVASRRERRQYEEDTF